MGWAAHMRRCSHSYKQPARPPPSSVAAAPASCAGLHAPSRSHAALPCTGGREQQHAQTACSCLLQELRVVHKAALAVVKLHWDVDGARHSALGMLFGRPAACTWAAGRCGWAGGADRKQVLGRPATWVLAPALATGSQAAAAAAAVRWMAPDCHSPARAAAVGGAAGGSLGGLTRALRSPRKHSPDVQQRVLALDQRLGLAGRHVGRRGLLRARVDHLAGWITATRTSLNEGNDQLPWDGALTCPPPLLPWYSGRLPPAPAIGRHPASTWAVSCAYACALKQYRQLVPRSTAAGPLKGPVACDGQSLCFVPQHCQA